MKNIFTKKVALAILLLTSTTMGGYYLGTKRRIPGRESQILPKAKDVSIEGINFKSSENALQSCYQDLLRRDPTKDDGQVLYHMMLTAQGEVSSLELVSSDFNEDQFHNCLTESIKKHRMPASADHVGVLIAHHFKFHRKDQVRADF